MKHKKYVLWIEDDASYNLASFASTIMMNPNYDLTLAASITDAIQELSRRVYDVIVLDLRLPPGADPKWVELYTNLLKLQRVTRLGLNLLLNIFNRAEDDYRIPLPSVLEDNRKLSRYCIFSVESFDEPTVKRSLERVSFDRKYYKQKSVNMPTNTLLTLINERLSNPTPNEDNL